MPLFRVGSTTIVRGLWWCGYALPWSCCCGRLCGGHEIPVEGIPSARTLKALDLWHDDDGLEVSADDEAAIKGMVLDLDDLSPSLDAWASTQRATRRRGEPFGDPAMHHHDDVVDISKDDLRAILRGVVRDTVAATVKAEIAKAFRAARGRVD
jgi:hypothetical protein